MPGESLLFLLTGFVLTALAVKYAPFTLLCMWMAGIVLFLATRGKIPLDLILRPVVAYASGAVFIVGVLADVVLSLRRAGVKALAGLFRRPSP
jgi:hypothetical protein